MKVLVIGSSVIDLFLEVSDKEKAISKDGFISLRLGDKIPVDINKLALGGDGANISVGLKRLSFETSFYTFLGKDLFSKEVEDIVRKEGIELIAQHEGENSFISMIFNFDTDRVAFTHREVRENSFNYEGQNPDFIYLSSIGSKWEEAFKKILAYAKENNIKMGFTPGGPQLEEPSDLLIETFKSSKIVFLNKEEAQRILKFQNQDASSDIKDLLVKVKTLGMEVLSITDGLSGAYVLDNSGNYYSIKPFGNNHVDRIGAGDAYACGFLSGYLLGMKTEDCMKRGAFNAYSVVKKIGAQEGLLRIEEMEKMEEDNGDYKAIQF